MVFYYTSTNIKMLKNILFDFEKSEMSPYEYMMVYTENSPETIDETKLSWISNTFLGIEKHFKFLQEIVENMLGDMDKEGQYYGIILLYAITFQITPSEKESLYKSLYNISKPLLDLFTKFLSNNEILIYISQVAQTTYDTDFITEKIISPLFIWQPYLSEMAHKYAEYIKITEKRKLKPLTVPVQLNVLNRKPKETSPHQLSTSPLSPEMPPIPSTHKLSFKNHLTKSAIDKKLKAIREKNKEKAINLLNEVKNKDIAHTKKSEEHKRASLINEGNDVEYEKCISKPRKLMIRNNLPPIPIKETKTTLRRINKRLQEVEEEEIEFLHDMVVCHDPQQFEKLENYTRKEKQIERLLEIKKKHVLGQISHEEALIAKTKVHEHNRRKYEEFLKERQLWLQEIEKWKKEKMVALKKQYENISINELNVTGAKMAVLDRNKKNALKCRHQNKLMLAEVMKEKQEELDRRIKIVKEIKVMAMIAKKARVPKIVDFTETSGFGFLCEMSMTELQERLSALKICIKDELDNKRALIKQRHTAAKQELEEVKSSIETYLADRASFIKQRKLKRVLEVQPTKELLELQNTLEEKRKLRLKLSKDRVF